MNSTRYSMNWISATLSAIFIVTYLVAPFYSLSMTQFSLSGFNIIGLNVAAILPVALGIVMAIGACLFPPIVAVIVEALTTVTMLIFMFLGNTLAASAIGVGLDLPAEWVASLSAVMNVTTSIHPGWGAIVCVGLCIAVLVFDIIANLRTRSEHHDYIITAGDDVFTGSNDSNDFGPF